MTVGDLPTPYGSWDSIPEPLVCTFASWQRRAKRQTTNHTETRDCVRKPSSHLWWDHSLSCSLFVKSKNEKATLALPSKVTTIMIILLKWSCRPFHQWNRRGGLPRHIDWKDTWLPLAGWPCCLAAFSGASSETGGICTSLLAFWYLLISVAGGSQISSI